MSKIYLDSLDARVAKEIDYKFELPIFGKSNTDQSYYEPQSSRIANMKKAANAAAIGSYDFPKGKKIDLEDTAIPIGRKLGILPEEISQLETLNNQSIKNADEKDKKAAKEKKEYQDNSKELAVQMAKAISESNNQTSEE